MLDLLSPFPHIERHRAFYISPLVLNLSSQFDDKKRDFFAVKRQFSMNSTPSFAVSRQSQQDVILGALLSPAETRALQRRAKAGEVQRLHPGVYLVCGPTSEEICACVQRNWQHVARAIVPGGVISHISAMTTGALSDGRLTLSHPTMYRRTITLPCLSLILMQGPGPLSGDMPLGSTGLHWASRARMLLENVGRKAPSKAGREEVEHRLIKVLKIIKWCGKPLVFFAISVPNHQRCDLGLGRKARDQHRLYRA